MKPSMPEQYLPPEIVRENEIEHQANQILKTLGLEWKDLHHKKVLEIGPGLAELTRAAKKRGITVVPLEKNPDLWEDEGGLPKEVPYVIGDATKMPFENESFDIVLAKAAPPTISSKQEEVVLVINEALRVLRPGGSFRFGPLPLNASILPDDLFTPEEDKIFSPAQRIQRVSERSTQFLREHWPNVLIQGKVAVISKESI